MKELFVLTHCQAVLGIYEKGIQAKFHAANVCVGSLKWVKLTDHIQIAFKNPQIPWMSYRITKVEMREKCYDCGSTIPGHHTPLCDMASDTDLRDLSQREGTQHWTGEIPS